MGYRIIYGKRDRRIPKGNWRIFLLIAACIGLLAAAHFYTPPQLPEQALENMVSSVQDGRPLSDAITAFCREIIENAENIY
jgi:hypothetical protein